MDCDAEPITSFSYAWMGAMPFGKSFEKLTRMYPMQISFIPWIGGRVLMLMARDVVAEPMAFWTCPTALETAAAATLEAGGTAAVTVASFFAITPLLRTAVRNVVTASRGFFGDAGEIELVDRGQPCLACHQSYSRRRYLGHCVDRCGCWPGRSKGLHR